MANRPKLPFELHPECCWLYDPAKVQSFVERLRAGEIPPPIVLCGGKLLDGVHRLEAWIAVGFDIGEIPQRDLSPDEDPGRFVHTQHQGTRQLTISQMAEQVKRRMAATEFDLERCLKDAAPNPAYAKLLRLRITQPGRYGKNRKPSIAPAQASTDPLEEHRAIRAAAELKAENKRLLERLDRATKRNEVAKDVGGSDIVFTPAPAPAGKRRLTAVVLASDWHVEEPVNKESVGGVNEYNLKIADDRIKRFFNAIIWNIEHQRASGHLSIDDLVMWLGGDFISGYIHKDLERSNFLSPTEAIRWLKPRIAAGLREVRKHVSSIRCPVSYGNHGRLNAKALVSMGAEDSIEQLMYHMLADELHGVADFIIPETNHVRLKIYNYSVHWHHGDDIRGGGGIGGLAPPLLRRVARWDEQEANHADYHCLGHHHTAIDFGRVVVNGSLIGFGPFSQSIGATGEPPQQILFFIDEKRGKTMLTPLWCGRKD
jgi:hypothetical protein